MQLFFFFFSVLDRLTLVTVDLSQKKTWLIPCLFRRSSGQRWRQEPCPVRSRQPWENAIGTYLNSWNRCFFVVKFNSAFMFSCVLCVFMFSCIEKISIWNMLLVLFSCFFFFFDLYHWKLVGNIPEIHKIWESPPESSPWEMRFRNPMTGGWSDDLTRGWATRNQHVILS